MTVTQIGGELAQLGVQILFECVGIAGIRGFRVCGLRDQTILVDQRNEHLPPAAVIGNSIVDDFEHAAVGRLVKGCEHVLQIRIRFLDCVPEEQVGFGELEILKLPTMHELIAQGVERGEHPAAAGMFLIRDRALLEFNREIARQGAHAMVIGGGLQYAHAGGCVCRDRVRPVGVEPLGEFVQLFWPQRLGIVWIGGVVLRHDAPCLCVSVLSVYACHAYMSKTFIVLRAGSGLSVACRRLCAVGCLLSVACGIACMPRHTSRVRSKRSAVRRCRLCAVAYVRTCVS